MVAAQHRLRRFHCEERDRHNTVGRLHRHSRKLTCLTSAPPIVEEGYPSSGPIQTVKVDGRDCRVLASAVFQDPSKWPQCGVESPNASGSSSSGSLGRENHAGTKPGGSRSATALILRVAIGVCTSGHPTDCASISGAQTGASGSASTEAPTILLESAICGKDPPGIPFTLKTIIVSTSWPAAVSTADVSTGRETCLTQLAASASDRTTKMRMALYRG
jgi:hypothetical protein